ncbi:MAG: MFS transporter [Solirubrobacteraceae bacterium]|nr:MFS transporter [Solirubrobacteraceae bacterium]
MDAGATGLDDPRREVARGRALRSFLGVFASTLLCVLAIGAVLPILPRYVTGPLGGGDVAVGVVIGAFTVTALISRPIGGRLADLHGRKAVHSTGIAIVSLAGLLLSAPLGIVGLLFARLVVGFGEGMVFAAGLAWVVDLSTGQRRGRAIGIFGLAIWGGLGLGSMVGQITYDVGGFRAVWALAALAPLVGLLIARAIPPGAPRPQPIAEAFVEAEAGLRHGSGSAPGGRAADARDTHATRAGDAPATVAPAEPAGGWRMERWLPAATIKPGVALALSNVGYAALAAFVVLLLDERGIGHGASVFSVYAIALIVTRLFVGGLPDRIGPRRASTLAGLAMAAGMAVIAAAHLLTVALAGAIVFGMGASLLFPSLALIVAREADERRRGVAMGAFSAFFDLGFGLGAPIAGVVASFAGYPGAFWFGALTCLAGALVGWLGTRGLAAAGAPALAGSAAR